VGMGIELKEMAQHEGIMLVNNAMIFAEAAHGAVGQLRKYTHEDYIVHPIAVSKIVGDVEGATFEMIAAALLHDVVEDTKITHKMINRTFGETVASYVYGLTNYSKPEDGNRARRKEIDRAFLQDQCAEVQTIKVADLIHNSETILMSDRAFAKIYIPEKLALLRSLTKADKGLRDIAFAIANEALDKLGIKDI
jgi:(p)ppGpp synthase/HD superfamily hydrolase